jgi:hypothetical protein
LRKCALWSACTTVKLKNGVGRENTANLRIVGWILSGGGVNHYPNLSLPHGQSRLGILTKER